MSTVIVVLNETIMVVALPHVMVDLAISASAGQWLTTAYMLTMAVLIPTSGFVLQRWSAQAVFGGALGVFTLGTLLAAVAPGFPLLLVARVVQAAGASMMGPLLMSTVLRTATPGQRGRQLGTVAIVMAVAPALGPVVSGLLLQFVSWRSMFLLVLPVTVAALVLGLIRLAGADQAQHRRLDVVSVALSIPGFGCLVLGLNRLAESGESGVPAQGLLALGIGVVCLAGFFARQVRLQDSRNPLLDLRVLGYASYRWSIGVLLLAMMVNFGVVLLTPLFLQNVRGLDPMTTGLVMLGGGVLSGVVGRVSGRLCDRYGPRWLMTPGAAILTLATFTFGLSISQGPVWLLAVQYALIVGLGMGLIATPALTNGTNPLEPQLYPHGIAFVSTFQQVAGAAGNAFLVTVMTVYAGSAAGAHQGDAAGIRASMWVAAGIALIALVLSLFVRRGAAAGQPLVSHPLHHIVTEENSPS
ncbi:DHA2 family efflux MFS transporter permease subunit [Jiangella alkaliphila]|uniref:DHA2 family efflux MFS transporter permease subunit n=1 Tax=Jiangella alkaliphila TaxID=419479 RepID=UPI001F1D14F6|nr:DHA2 family efflux MFS transporter permease subunit [Jiangella alkaliphila]